MEAVWLYGINSVLLMILFVIWNHETWINIIFKIVFFFASIANLMMFLVRMGFVIVK